MKNFIIKKFEKELTKYLNLPKTHNKNFLISYKFYHLLSNNAIFNNIKKIKYNELEEYVKNNYSKKEIIYIVDFEKENKIRNKVLYNIIALKVFNKKKINLNFIFFIKTKIDSFYNNSYIFI